MTTNISIAEVFTTHNMIKKKSVYKKMKKSF